jgi:hypothetical protein
MTIRIAMTPGFGPHLGLLGQAKPFANDCRQAQLRFIFVLFAGSQSDPAPPDGQARCGKPLSPAL